MKKLFTAVCLVSFAVPVTSVLGQEFTSPMVPEDNVAAPLSSGGPVDRGNGRWDFGWLGTGGGNLEAYSKEATGNFADRSGEFKFIFGGGPTMGKVLFTHYNGTRWTDQIVIMPNGDLTSKGAIKATQMVVDTVANIWPDYVFTDSYSLMPISELKEFIEREGHLPGMPTAADIAENGHDLGLVSMKTLEKVEELALYVIQLRQENEGLRQELDTLKAAIAD